MDDVDRSRIINMQEEWCGRVGLDRPADSIILAITGIGVNRG